MSEVQPSKRSLLLQPPSGLYRRDDRCQSKVDDQTVRIVFPPIYLAYMAAMLEQVGVECRILDASATSQGWSDCEEEMRRFSPDLIVVGVAQGTFEQDRYAFELAKNLDPEICTVARGELFLTEDKSALERSPELDIVIRGESEWAIQEIGAGKPLEEIRGITYRKDSEIVRNPNRPSDEDLDRLPYPARHLLDNSLYISPETREPLTVIQANRGCPARCIFCPAWSFSGRTVRNRSPENIVGEIQQCVEKYGISEFYFNGDTFTYDKEWTIDLCRKIVDYGLKIRWGCNSRVDTIDGERLEWMKRAGCWVVGFGIETGSEETLERIGKGTTLDQARQAVALCKRHSMRVHTFFVIGFPWETRKHIQDTISFIHELDPDFFDINIVTPLRGTPLWGMMQRSHLMETESGSYAQAGVRTTTLSARELTGLRRRALWGLYLRPVYVWRTLVRAGSWSKRLNYLRAAWNRARGLLGLR